MEYIAKGPKNLDVYKTFTKKETIWKYYVFSPVAQQIVR